MPLPQSSVPWLWSSGLTFFMLDSSRCVSRVEKGHKRVSSVPSGCTPRVSADGSSDTPSAAPRSCRAHRTAPAPPPYSPAAALPRPVPPAAHGEGDGQCQDDGSAQQRGGHRHAGPGARGLRGGCGQGPVSGAGQRDPPLLPAAVPLAGNPKVTFQRIFNNNYYKTSW